MASNAPQSHVPGKSRLQLPPTIYSSPRPDATYHKSLESPIYPYQVSRKIETKLAESRVLCGRDQPLSSKGRTVVFNPLVGDSDLLLWVLWVNPFKGPEGTFVAHLEITAISKHARDRWQPPRDILVPPVSILLLYQSLPNDILTRLQDLETEFPCSGDVFYLCVVPVM